MKIPKKQWKSMNSLFPWCCMLFYCLSSGLPWTPRWFPLFFFTFYRIFVEFPWNFIDFHGISLIFIENSTTNQWKTMKMTKKTMEIDENNKKSMKINKIRYFHGVVCHSTGFPVTSRGPRVGSISFSLCFIAF